MFAAVKTQSSSDLHLLDLAAAPINVPVTPSSSTINISFLTGSDEDFNVNSSIQLQDAIWHSSAHILGWALETKYGDSILLDNGPAISDGFFYDGLLTTAGSEFVSKTLDRLDNTSDGTSWLDRLIEESYTSSSASSIYHNGSNIKSANIISNILKSYATSASSLLFHYTAAASAATNLQPSPSIFSAKEEDLTHLESIMKTLVAKRAKFERMVVPLNVAVAMFASNPFKLKYLYRLASLQQQQQQQRQQFITVYRCGDFIDLCRGPHLPHTGFVKAFKLTQTSSSQWTTLPTPSSSLSPASSASSLPSSPSNALTRITGTSFLSSAALATHLHSKATAQARDHRAIGTKQSLFFFHPYSPGSPFLLPHGTRIMNALVGMLRGEYRRRGFDEVVTPLLFDKRLWQVSGHWENYRDDMFSIGMGKGSSINGGTLGETGFSSSITSPGGLEGSCSHSHTNHSEEIHSHKGNTTENGDEEQVYGLKPMNCPGHCLMYASSTRSYKDLPIRYAEFSPLHRYVQKKVLYGEPEW